MSRYQTVEQRSFGRLQFSLVVYAAYVGVILLISPGGLRAQDTFVPDAVGDRATIAAGDESDTKTVTLTIDYADGFQKRFVSMPWREGLTILDLLQVAKKHKRAGFSFTFQGHGATALLLKIDDVSNLGGGKRNWIYYVNQRKADRSFAIQALQPGDEVLWRFETYL